MKKCVHLLISMCLVFSFVVCTTSAAISPYVEQNVEVISFENGDSLEIVTTITENLRASSKTVSKNYIYKSNGKNAVCYTLYGSFTYDGKTSKAIDASADATIYQSGWSLPDHEESYSGSTVRGTAVFSGPSGDKTLGGSITCDKNGNIS